MEVSLRDAYFYGGTGGKGGQGGQHGGDGGIGQGSIVQINNANSVHVHEHHAPDYHKIMDFLSPINFLPRQQEIFKTRHKETGSWVLNHPSFLEWKSGSRQLLWCSGIPGAGKTVLASVAFNALQNSGAVVACAFLNYKESGTQTLENVIGAIVRQLALQQELQLARTLYEKHTKQKTLITLDELQTLLAIYAQKYTQVYIILDALDEYFNEADRDQLLEIIFGVAGNIKLWVTCRPSITPPPTLQCIHLEIQPPVDDIEAYIRSQMGKHRRLKRFAQDEIVKNKIIESITSKAAGMFLFVKLQMDLLGLALTEDELLEALEKLPKDLKSLYTTALEQIKLKNSRVCDIGLAALGWIAFAKRPLTVHELRAALAIPFTQPFMPSERSMVQLEDILDACQGLIIVNQTDEQQIIRLVHYSAQEFMNDIQAQEFEHIHIVISKTLLVCLSWAAHSYASENCHEYDPIDVQIHPLLEYSQYFLRHIKGKNTEILLKADFLAGAQNVHKYPQWYIDPWYSNRGFIPHSPIELAVAGNLLYIAKDLLGDPEQVQQVSYLICVAARYGYQEMLELLIAADSAIAQQDLNLALYDAAYGGHKISTEYLLLLGANMNVDLDQLHGTALNAAAGNGHQSIVETLLQAKADPHFLCGSSWDSPLQAAAGRGHEKIVDILLQAGVDPNLHGKSRTALQVAASGGYQTIVKMLLEAKADPNPAYADEVSALHHAAQDGHQIMVVMLLQAKADPNLINTRLGTPLQAAAASGHQTIVELLLQANADPNLIGGEYGTALQAATVRGYQTIAELLLLAQADPNLISTRFGTPLQAAAELGHQAIVEILLQAEADPNLMYGKDGTALQVAARQGYQNIVELLLWAQADPNHVCGENGTALQAAARWGYKTIVELLLQAHADPNLMGGESGTALQAAASGGCNILQLMLRANGDPHLIYIDGKSAARWRDKVAIVELLLEAHADPNLVGGQNGTALQAAALWGEQGIVQVLLQANADPNLIGGEYGTALQAAARWGYQAIVELLLQVNADPNLIGGEYSTALHAAAYGGHESVVKILLQANADPSYVGGKYGSPIRAAAHRGHRAVVKCLMKTKQSHMPATLAERKKDHK